MSVDLYGVEPFTTAQKALQGRWTILILHLVSEEPLRFNELLRRLPQMTHATLSKQLKRMEENGLIVRTEYLQVPPKVEYTPSELGRAFGPALEQIGAWGEAYIEYLGSRREQGETAAPEQGASDARRQTAAQASTAKETPSTTKVPKSKPKPKPKPKPKASSRRALKRGDEKRMDQDTVSGNELQITSAKPGDDERDDAVARAGNGTQVREDSDGALEHAVQNTNTVLESEPEETNAASWTSVLEDALGLGLDDDDASSSEAEDEGEPQQQFSLF